ncbi:uncharacterized protein [Choristoneura fumiferana]|uniref:uncharacterized protein n=1 Tax=Choristoneura fumiferana TaxID=7141 RepID=UPI003D15A003
MKLWTTLLGMSREPHPQVAQMAGDIIGYISNQLDNVGREIEGRALAQGACGAGAGGSASLPPSPNLRAAAARSARGTTRARCRTRRTTSGAGAAGCPVPSPRTPWQAASATPPRPHLVNNPRSQ